MFLQLLHMSSNFGPSNFAAAMLKLSLVSFVVLNLAGCHTSPVHTSSQTTQDGGISRQQGDMINALCLAICPSDQTGLKECHRIYNMDQEIPFFEENVLSTLPYLICRSSSSLTVGWASKHDEATFWAELMVEQNPLNPASLRVHNATATTKEIVEFENLNETTKYYVRLTAFNASGQLGDPVITKEIITLPDNFTPEAPVNMSLEDIIYTKKNGFQGTLKWKPAEDYTCFYDLVIFYGFKHYLQEELQVPRDFFERQVTLTEFSKNYTFILKSRNKKVNKESDASVYSFFTNSCLDMHKNVIDCQPLPPSNIKVEEVAVDLNDEFSGAKKFSSYDITIQWDEPEYKPDYYLLNLSSPINRHLHITRNISGTSTNETIENAPVGRAYFFIIVAVSPWGRSISIIKHQNIKMRHFQDSRNTGALLWAIISPIMSFVAVIVVGVFVYHRREKTKLKKKRCRYFEELDQKAPKEAETGSIFIIPQEDDVFEVNPDKIMLYEVLGEGAFGVVRRGWLPDNNREIAVKMLKDGPSAEEVKQFRQEIDMMKSVGGHPHIVSLLGCCTRPSSTMMLVVEFCSRGDLQNYLRWTWEVMSSQNVRKPLLQSSTDSSPEEQVKYTELQSPENSEYNGSIILSQPNLIVNRMYDLQHIIKENEDESKSNITAVDLLSFSRQIAMGMEFLSSNRVVHRDLAARNVLVCADKTVKIADFGLSRDIYQENMYKKTGSGKLPVKWMAIECLTHQVYTTQSDVWSFGILLWEIVTLGGNPYPSIPTGRLLKLLQSGYRMECPVNCSLDLYHLMVSCWQSRAKDRPAFSDICIQLDKMLDGVCSEAYLTLDIIDHKNTNEIRIIANEQLLSKGSDNTQINQTSESERYVRPITLGRKPQPNHYISQPNYPNSRPTIRSSRTTSFTAGHKNQFLDKQKRHVMSDSSFVITDALKLDRDERMLNRNAQDIILNRANSVNRQAMQQMKSSIFTQ